MSDERVDRIASIVYDAMPDDPFTKPMTSDGFELPYPYAYRIAATHYPDRKAVRKAREAAQKIVAELDEENPLDSLLGEEFRINAAGRRKGNVFAYVSRHSITRHEPSFHGTGPTIDDAVRAAVQRAKDGER